MNSSLRRAAKNIGPKPVLKLELDVMPDATGISVEKEKAAAPLMTDSTKKDTSEKEQKDVAPPVMMDAIDKERKDDRVTVMKDSTKKDACDKEHMADVIVMTETSNEGPIDLQDDNPLGASDEDDDSSSNKESEAVMLTKRKVNLAPKNQKYSLMAFTLIWVKLMLKLMRGNKFTLPAQLCLSLRE